MPYQMNNEDYGRGLDLDRNSLNSYGNEDGNDYSGERNPVSARNPDYPNKYMQDARGTNSMNQ
jgi:hypothetical protein